MSVRISEWAKMILESVDEQPDGGSRDFQQLFSLGKQQSVDLIQCLVIALKDIVLFNSDTKSIHQILDQIYNGKNLWSEIPQETRMSLIRILDGKYSEEQNERT